jgi:hypothetical protein
MRNDARPIGPHSPASPVGGPPARDSRESVADDRQSHTIHNWPAEEAERDKPEDPVMPADDSALNTKI